MDNDDDGDGVNDGLGLCVAAGQDPSDPNAEVDPTRTCTAGEKVILLVSCKDNCRGGRSDPISKYPIFKGYL